MSKTKAELIREVLAAIANGNVSGAVQHFAPRFIQHDPAIGEGLAGLEAYIQSSPPQQTVVRLIEDASFVMVQLHSELTGEHRFEVYRFENGLIAEHWSFTSPQAPPNKSGHTQIDGPTKPEHLEDTEGNVAFLRRYYETFHLGGDHRDHNQKFFTGDTMIRHEPGVRDGLQEFLHDVAELMQHRTIDEIRSLFGQGDLVFVAAYGTHEGKPCAYIDLYRIENAKVVEHWGFPQMFPFKSNVKNNQELL